MLHDVDTVPKLTLDVCTVPFMIQIKRCPVELFCQRMSALPSPLKSDRLGPLLTMVAARNARTRSEERRVVREITRCPVELCCQRMSALPSQLKSLEPSMLHVVGTVPKLTVDLCVVPFMSQITRCPVELFCQRMSALPSPLKSDRLGPPLTMVAPRNARTWPIGLAIASTLVPAKSSPTACGVVATSSTIIDPESPLLRK